MTKNSVCDSCSKKSENCHDSCTQPKTGKIKRNEIKNVIAVMSGKGGVGKSTVTVLLAAMMKGKGYQVGILDGDITGPSIPRLLGLKGGRVETGANGIIASETASGVRVMSLNLFLENEDEAVIWRGPVIAGAVKQFWEEVEWGELDYLFVDLPPGTGDVPLTVIQSIPLKGVVIVLSPQDLAIMVVKKAINMARQMNVPILGLVENMAYLDCPHCGGRIYPFGQPQGAKVSQETGIPLLATLPIRQQIAGYGDTGQMEALDTTGLVDLAEALLKQIK